MCYEELQLQETWIDEWKDGQNGQTGRQILIFYARGINK